MTVAELCRRSHAIHLDTCSTLVGLVEPTVEVTTVECLDTRPALAGLVEAGSAQIHAIPLDACAASVAWLAGLRGLTCELTAGYMPPASKAD